jgi:hypothetical protein
VRWLLARGLLVPIDDDTVELPREVGLAVRGAAVLGDLQPDPPPLETTPARDVDGAATLAAAETVAKVEALLEAWTASPPGRPARRRAGRARAQARRRAMDTDEAHAALLVEVAAAAGLVDQTPGLDPEWVPTPVFDAGRPGRRSSAGRPSRRPGSAMTRCPGLVGERDDRDKVLAPLGPDVERPARRPSADGCWTRSPRRRPAAP